MIVITGATGNIGQSLVRILAESGEQVRAVSRGQLPIDLPDGVQHQRADLAAPETLPGVLEGAKALFLFTGPETRNSDATIEAIRASGIRRVVLLSSQGAATRPNTVSHSPERIEGPVRNSDLDWTILRPGNFASRPHFATGLMPARRTSSLARPRSHPANRQQQSAKLSAHPSDSPNSRAPKPEPGC